MTPDPVVNHAAPRYIPVAKPSLTHAEAQAAYDCVIGGQVSQGPLVARFEHEFADAHGKRFGVALNSGTSALHLALIALNVRPGDEVIVPTFAFIAVGNAVLYSGANPVFVDSEPETGNADPEELERAVSPRTSAIIAVHTFGVPAESFLSACHTHAPNVPVIQDCAEAHYASCSRGYPIGAKSRLSCFSFYANKIVTTGDGGMILINDGQTADRLRSLRSHASTPKSRFVHTELGYNYRMTEMSAAIGLAQHARRAEFIAHRAALVQRYVEQMAGIPWLKFQARSFGSANWTLPVLVDRASRRDALRTALAQAGAETRAYFTGLHRQPHLRRYADREYPVCDDLSARGICLPLFADMTIDDVDYVSATIRGSA